MAIIPSARIDLIGSEAMSGKRKLVRNSTSFRGASKMPMKLATLTLISCLLILTTNLSSLRANESPATPNDEMETANASSTSVSTSEIILEDLANQILKKTSEEKSARQSRERVHFHLNNGNAPLPPQKIYLQEASPNFVLDQNQTSQRFNDNQVDENITTVHLTASTPLPYMHLIAMSTSQPTTFEATEEDEDIAYGSNATSGGKHMSSMIKEYEDDRHINYADVEPAQSILYSDGSLPDTLTGNHSNLVFGGDQSAPLPTFNFEAEQLRSKLASQQQQLPPSVNDSTTSGSLPELRFRDSNSSASSNRSPANETFVRQPTATILKPDSLVTGQAETVRGEKLDFIQTTTNDRPFESTSNSLLSNEADPMTSSATLTLATTTQQPPIASATLTLSPITILSSKGDDDQAESQQTTTGAARSGTIQARSMGHLQGGGGGGPLNRMLHHSKAPYASNYQSQFQNRASIVSDMPTVDASSKLASSSSPRQLDSQLTGDQAALLVHSLNRISSHLADSSSQIDRPQTNKPEASLSQQHQIQNPSQAATSGAGSGARQEQQMPQPIQPTVSADQQQQLQKLATSASHFVDLTPIPIQGSSLGSSGDGDPSSEMPSRYFDHSTIAASEFQSLSGSSLASTQRLGGGSGSVGDSMTTLRVSYPTKIAHDFKNGSPESLMLKQQQQQQTDASLPSVSLHRKTLESVGNQLADRNHADHLPAIGGNDNFQRRNGHQTLSQVNQQQGNFAASLINVTAPMTPPISATEAMESTLDQQAAKNLLHQASGFLGHAHLNGSASSGGGGSSNNINRIYSQNNTRQQHQFPSTSPSSLTTETQPRIYSQPANYFSPSMLQKQQTFYTSSNQQDNSNNNYNDSLVQNERTRYGDMSLPVFSMSPRAPSSHLSSGGADLLSHSQQQHHHQQQQQQQQQHHAAQASGFRSPTTYLSTQGNQPVANLFHTGNPLMSTTSSGQQQRPAPTHQPTTAMPQQMPPTMAPAATTVTQLSTTTNPMTNNGFITGTVTSSVAAGTLNGGSSQQVAGDAVSSQSSGGGGSGGSNANRRAFNLTRVEHISAECSNDLIRTVIMFNGTFKGIIYSSGFVREPNCLYINGTGKTRYDFSIRLNQCGTLSRSDLHPPAGPNEVRRRDQVMWNTLSIQYNPIIEQEWDEHFRVSCEYGSDFWKTVSFSPFNVETNTGSPVVFTVDPPKCQMEILKGHGMVGPRQEAISGPVTVGDPLTLLIHMKSERAGYDILVKNCIAHNGGNQRMQLIDANGCVVNERFISPFRGTYNDNDLKHVTLYSYLKAFRFTGKPVLYLECEVHMCQTACPPQMCYWRRLSKRSTNETEEIEFGEQDFTTSDETTTTITPVDEASLGRQARRFNFRDDGKTVKTTTEKPAPLSDSLSLFQALEVLEDRAVEPYSSSLYKNQRNVNGHLEDGDSIDSLMCYQRAEVFAFLFTTASALLAALSITVGCCWRAASLTSASRRANERKKLYQMGAIY